MAIGIFGGAFDPPHNGHLAVARGALEQLDLARLVVLVSERPGHREVASPAPVRLELAQAAFGALERTVVELDPYARTIDLLRARPDLDEPVVIVGADQLAAFATWREPDEVLRLARLGVATRPGVDEGRIARVLGAISAPERVRRFDIEAVDVSSSEVRVRVARGLEIVGLVPAAVAAAVERLGLYRRSGASASG